MHIKVNLRVAEGVKTPGRRGPIWESWKISHGQPLSLTRLLVNICLHITAFWVNIGCGSAKEATLQLHKAADELASMEW